MSFLAEVLAHSSFFMAFLVGFYFLFVTKIQINALVDDLFGMVKDSLTSGELLTPNLKSVISDAIKANSTDVSSSKISDALKNNGPILKSATITVSVLAPLFLIIAILLQYFSGKSVFDLIVGNLIVILFIACAEFAIVGIFMSNFVEIDKDFVKSMFAIRLSSTDNERPCNFVNNFEKDMLPEFIYKMFNPDTQGSSGTPAT